MSYAHYLLQVNIYLIIFYAFYKVLLDKETYFTLNRIYLVSAVLFSLSIPFLKLSWLTEQKVSQQVYNSVNWQAAIERASVITVQNTNLDWTTLLIITYLLGVVFFAFKLLYGFIRVKKQFELEANGEAFSFLGKKYIDKQLPESDIIDVHEEIHVKQLHSIDILILEIAGVINWFNPIVWFYKKSIKAVHEFLADEVAANFKGDKKAYSLLLLSKSMGVSPNDLLSSFNSKSVLKERILMLHKTRSKKVAVLKYGIFFPLFILIIILSSAGIRKSKTLKTVAANFPIEEKLKVVEVMLDSARSNNLKLDKKVFTAIKVKKDSKLNIDSQTVNMEDLRVEVPELEINDQSIYDFVSIDKQPEFQGGINKFYSYLSKSLRYPKLAQENNVQGKVFLSFVVEKNGSLSDIQITRGLGSGTDEEAKRVLQESPKWVPGTQNGKSVRVKYNINVNFNLVNEIYKHRKETDNEASRSFLKTSLGRLLVKPAVIINNDKYIDFDDVKAISPKDIQSMVVLKGDDAKLKYGVKGENGIILLQLKKGVVY
jgi:TonB family protein